VTVSARREASDIRRATVVRLDGPKALALHGWMHAAWSAGDDRWLRDLVRDAATELEIARINQAFLVEVLTLFLPLSAPAPRNEELERIAIVYLLLGVLTAEDVEDLYDWHRLHAPLVEELRALPDVGAAVLGGFVPGPPEVLCALNDTYRWLPHGTPRAERLHALSVVERLRALQRQRRALGATTRALKALGAEGGETRAEHHLHDALQALEGA